MTFETSRRPQLRVLDPNFEQKIRHSFEHQGFKRLGGELTEINLGHVRAELPYSEFVRQQHGLFHGGVVAMAADSASGYATYTVLPPEEECVSAEFKINFMQPARGERLIARGGIIKVGRTLVIAEATVSVLRGGEEIECAIMLHTLARIKHMKSGKNE
ncbi:MAG TPA: PaaI family thioesterase [Candidatus Obscuribacterales bacterium]